MLEIDSRKKKSNIVGHEWVKRILKNSRPHPRDLKTSIRLQQDITIFYSNPTGRRRIWQEFYEHTSGFQEPLPPGIPSLEYQALHNFDENFSSVTVDDGELSNCDAFFEDESERPDWWTPALAMLPFVRAEFMNWDSITQERRQETLLAAFSIATLLDDVRLLRWAAGEIADITKEFSFATVSQGEQAESVQGVAADETTEGIDGQSEFSSEDSIAILQKACQNLSNAALELKNTPPSDALFDRIASHAGDVERLREPILEAAASNTAESLVDRFIEFLRDRAKDVAWLLSDGTEVDNIEAKWRDAYSTRDSGQIAEIQADVERGEQETAKQLELWALAAKETKEANDALTAYQRERVLATDIATRLKASEQEEQCSKAFHLSNSRETESMFRVLAAASPFGSEYTVGTDSTEQTQREAETGDVDDRSETDSASDSENGEIIKHQKEMSRPPQSVKATKTDQTRIDTAPEEVCPSSDKMDADKRIPDTAQESNDRTSTIDAEPEAEPENEEPQRPAPNEIAIWDAVRAGRIGLAYQIARLRPKVEPSGVMHPVPELLATAALGKCLCGPEGEVAQDFGKHAEVVLANPNFGDVDPDTKDALNLMLFSASVRPALFAPQTGAISILQGVELSRELNPVYQLANAIAGYTKDLQGRHFDIPRLTSILDTTFWADRFETHMEQVQQWRASAKTKRFRFNPAEKVWKYWLRKGNILIELTDLILDDSEASVLRVREIIRELADKKSFAHLVSDVSQNKLELKGGARISGRALTQLGRDVNEVLELARNWLRIIESKPGGEGFVENTVAKLREDIEKYAPRTSAAIAGVQERTPSVALCAALAWAHDSIESLSKLFGNERESSQMDDPQEPCNLLTHDLLYVAELNIGPDGGIDEESTPAEILALLTDTSSHMKTLVEAFEARLNRGDIAGAKAVRDLMAYEEVPNEDECQINLDRKSSAKRRDLERELYELSEKLEQAYNMGEASESEFITLNASIVSARHSLSRTGTDSVVACDRAVSGFKGNIQKCFDQGIRRIHVEFEEFLPLENEREQASVEHALETEDLITLHEQLDRLKNREHTSTEGIRQSQPFRKVFGRRSEGRQSPRRKHRPIPHRPG